jgi:predicted metal-dependent phosphoesterase TrpH
MVEKFVDAGIPMTIEELKHGDSSSVITRAHFARLLVEKGFVKDKAEAFDKYIAPRKDLSTFIIEHSCLDIASNR